ncbi:MAG: hypothetical protein CL840_00630 [Crocinitomicaceae bacterium]|nr:hypothetical protein [Crocinitomicaceae bacterium]|tara:strand:+ start:147003 stop:148124 length:1122 start_codon:yes stop_codon:yes gene_type:complete
MLLNRLIRSLKRQIFKTKLSSILGLIGVNLLVGFLCYSFMEEPTITPDAVTFIYWSIVTASSLGFGDISPVTDAGRLFLVLYYIPSFFLLFGLLLGKLGELVYKYRNDLMDGKLKMSNLSNHITLVTNNEKSARHLIKLIMSDENRPDRQIVLLTDAEFQHPFPDEDHIRFLKVDGLYDQSTTDKAYISAASRIVIDMEDDNANFALSVHFATKADSKGVITTFLQDESRAETLRNLGQNIEVITTFKHEQMVRAMQDTGTSSVFYHLLTNEMQTMHTQEVVFECNVPVKQLREKMQDSHNAIFMGFATDLMSTSLVVNPDNETILMAGQTYYVHYVALKRLKTSLRDLFDGAHDRGGNTSPAINAGIRNAQI